ncbi:MAG: helix-turn-helix domain-containing protein [Rickettsiales bacterium]
MQRVPIHRIRYRRAYSIVEVTELLSVHKNTVRQWMRGGLKAMDDTRPILIHGSELKRFLLDRRSSKKSPCKPHEFYCLKCRAPRVPWGKVVDVTIRSTRLFNMHAICEACETSIHKTANHEKLIAALKILRIQQVHPKHIIESLPPSLKCYFDGSAET